MFSRSGGNGPKPKTKSSGLGHWLAYEFDYTINQIISPIPKAIYCVFHYKMERQWGIMSASRDQY